MCCCVCWLLWKWYSTKCTQSFVKTGLWTWCCFQMGICCPEVMSNWLTKTALGLNRQKQTSCQTGALNLVKIYTSCSPGHHNAPHCNTWGIWRQQESIKAIGNQWGTMTLSTNDSSITLCMNLRADGPTAMSIGEYMLEHTCINDFQSRTMRLNSGIWAPTWTETEKHK